MEKIASKLSFATTKTAQTADCVFLLALTCRYLAGDRREEKQESQEYGEKCIHVSKRGRVRVWNSFPPRKSFFLRLLRAQPPVSLCLVGYYSSCCRGLWLPILSFLRFLSFRFLRTLADATLCFTRREGARTSHGEREGERESARARARLTSQGRSRLRGKLKETRGSNLDLGHSAVMRCVSFIHLYSFSHRKPGEKYNDVRKTMCVCN